MAGIVPPDRLAHTLGHDWMNHGSTAEALASALRSLIVDGRIAVRSRLPSERSLSVAVGVSRGTVTRAYDRLRELGFLESTRGSGSWTALPSQPAPVEWQLQPLRGHPVDLTIAALPAPSDLMSAALARAGFAFSRHASQRGYDELSGLLLLREAVAERFNQRGLPTNADQILVTAGGLHALHLLLLNLAYAGESVLVEAPAYPRTLAILGGMCTRPVPVPLTDEGWGVEAWADSARAANPRLAIINPDFQNPTGFTMSDAERADLVAVCARTGTTLLVDETFCELALDDEVGPRPVAVHDRAATVITMGTMSKAAWGGLRIGWVRATPRVVRELVARRAELDVASPVIEQLVAIELFAQWGDVVDSRRRLLRTWRDGLMTAIERYAPHWSVQRPSGGMSTWVRLDQPSSTSLAARASRDGIMITPGPAFGLEGAFERYFRLPFTLPPHELDDVVSRLALLSSNSGEIRGSVVPRPFPV